MFVRNEGLMIALLIGVIVAFAFPPYAIGSSWANLGFQYSQLTYTEPNIEMSGFLPGVGGQAQLYRDRSYSLNLAGRLSGGELAYDGETLETNPQPVTTATGNLLSNLEATIRFAEGFSNLSLHPHFGLGYRYWENNIEDSDGVAGYLREVDYLYLPVGFETPVAEGRDWSSTLNVSYRLFVEGTVTSHLSDANPSFPDVENTQDNGDGVTANYTYRRQTKYGSDYNIEIFLNVWDVAESDVVATGADIDDDDNDGDFTDDNDRVFEPENETVEFGGRLSVNF